MPEPADAAAGLDLLGRLLRAALAGEEGHLVQPVDCGGVPSGALLDAVRRHRVPEVLHASAAALGLPDDVRAVLDSWEVRGRQRLMLQTLETVRSWQLLAAHGIDALVVKGQALASLTTGRPDARGAGDVDLLVAPDSVVDAHRALVGAGWRLQEGARAEPGSWAWRHLNRWGNALAYAGDAADVDLHWRLDLLPDAHPSFDVLWSRRELVTVGTATVPTLSGPDALRHVATHREGWIWLRSLVDLRRLARGEAALLGALRNDPAVSLAAARSTIGLPATVPAAVHARLDEVPAELVQRVVALHAASVAAARSAAYGGGRSLRGRLTAISSMADLQHAAVELVLPAEVVFPVGSRSGWTGVPRALGLRVGDLSRRMGSPPSR